MSKLEKMFEGINVKWKSLGEICEVGDGNHSSKYPKSHEMVDSGVPVIRGTNIVNGTISDKDMKYITSEKHQELSKGHLKAYDVIIANRGEIGKIAYIPKHFAGSNLNSQLSWLRANSLIILPRYLFFALNTTFIQSSISGEGGALQQLTIKNIKLIRNPYSLPRKPKRINRNSTKNCWNSRFIYRAYSGSLQRSLQHEKYNIVIIEKLYSFDKNKVQHLPMDDESIGVFQRGKRFVKTDLISEGDPVIHYGEMYTHYGAWANETKSFISEELVKSKNLRVAQKGDVVIVAAGETIEDIGMGTAWLGEGGAVIHDACFSYKTSLNPKFVAYFTRTKQFH